MIQCSGKIAWGTNQSVGTLQIIKQPSSNILSSSNVIEYSQAFDNPFVQKLMHEEFYWTSFYLLKVHLESCPLKVVSCTNENCNKTMTRNNLQAHVTTTCPWRILQCCHCSDLYPARKTKVKVFFVLLLKLIVITKSFEVDRVRKRPPPPPPLPPKPTHTHFVIYVPL